VLGIDIPQCAPARKSRDGHFDTEDAEISDKRLIIEDIFIACTTTTGALP
jgi:hypothetical protein